jgi:hypothetical protein
MKRPDRLKRRPGGRPNEASSRGQEEGRADRRETDAAVEEEAGEVTIGTAESIGGLG